MGGSTLYIETLGQVQNREADRCIVNKYSYHQKAKEAGTGGGVELTGNLGDVMKESIKIGGTFARFALLPFSLLIILVQNIPGREGAREQVLCRHTSTLARA